MAAATKKARDIAGRRAGSISAEQPAASPSTTQVERMIDVLDDLRKRLDEIDRWRREAGRRRPKPVSAKEARALLEELKIPELKIIEEHKKR